MAILSSSDGLGELLEQVGDIIDILPFENTDQFCDIHPFNKELPDIIAHLIEDIAFLVGINEFPKKASLARGQGQA
jgi:hypothetical protein